MAKIFIEESTLSNIGKSIRAKTGRTSKISPLNMPAEIASIQTGDGGSSSPVLSNNATFYDYDGTIVTSYSLEEVQALTSLPTGPSHEGLTFQGWNWSLEAIKSMYREVNVGATYTTNDGKTRIYITLGEGRTSPLLGCCPNGTVIVDWGDGTTPDTLTGTSTSTIQYTPTHNYTSPGNYVISLTVDGTCGFLGGSETNNHCSLLKYSTTKDTRNQYYQNAITKIEFGDSVTSIGDYTFSDCDSLTNIVIPNSVTTIGQYAFYRCYSLTNIVIPDSVTSIGKSAFFECYSLTNITIPNGISSIGFETFDSCYSLTNIVIPDSVTAIGQDAFDSCYSLTNIVIPDSVTSIGQSAFSNCYSLTSIVIPDSVTSVGPYAFFSCYSLASIVIPNSVTTIGQHAFSKCYSLTNIVIPNSVTTIGQYAFESCFSLASIVIPDSVTSIGPSTFCYCYSLTNIVIPGSVTSIGPSAFFDCYSLASIVIPDSVTSIGRAAFNACYGMAEYHLKPTTPPALSNTDAFSSISDDCIIYVPQGSLEAYQTATNWTTYASHMQEETA